MLDLERALSITVRGCLIPFCWQENDKSKKQGAPKILPVVNHSQKGVSGRLNGCAVMMILNLDRKFLRQPSDFGGNLLLDSSAA